MSPDLRSESAALVDPLSIESRAPLTTGVELLVRHRSPGSVSLPHGQREHMLMSSIGRPIDAGPVSSVLQTRDRSHTWHNCPQGHITFVPASTPMEWGWNYQSESVHLTLLPEFMNGMAAAFRDQQSESPTLRPAFRMLDQPLHQLLHTLRSEMMADALGKDLVTSSLLQLIAARLFRLSGATSIDSAAEDDKGSFTSTDCKRSIELLNDRLADKIPLAELAAEFNLSTFHFIRVFKRETGFPPHEFQLQLRIARARELLISQPSRTLADLACELGFSDESHFRRHFCRIVGVTPGRFRQQQ